MKITILPSSGSPLICGNDAVGEFITDYQPDHARNFQDRKLFRAMYAGRFARGNRLNIVKWQVDREHPDYDASFEFYNTHADSIPDEGALEVNQGGITLWLTDATFDAPKCIKFAGVTTVFAYTAVGGAWSTKNPNT